MTFRSIDKYDIEEVNICKECTDWLRNLSTENYRDFLGEWKLDDFRTNENLMQLLELSSYAVRYENGVKSLLKFRRDMKENDIYTYRVISSSNSNEEYLVLIYV